MRTETGIDLETVKQVYDGSEGDLWQLLMGQQIHVGGLRSTLDLAERAGIAAGQSGVDLCCCNGAGMRALVRLRGVASMTGVDATETVVERGRRLCEAEGLADRIRFVRADACASGLPDASADFVWGEDAWCYVADKDQLVQEAIRIVKPGGTIAFTDWVEGPVSLEDAEAERFLRFMKFPSLQEVPGYRRALEESGCKVEEAADTGRFASYLDLYRDMIEMQLTYDAMAILGFETERLEGVAAETAFLQELAHAGKVIQARFVARKPPA